VDGAAPKHTISNGLQSEKIWPTLQLSSGSISHLFAGLIARR